jgi:hypothetical protein
MRFCVVLGREEKVGAKRKTTWRSKTFWDGSLLEEYYAAALSKVGGVC